MSPIETRHYEAISRIDAEVKSLHEKMDERYKLDREEHTHIKNTLDEIWADMKTCPHIKLDETENRLDKLASKIDSLMVCGVIAFCMATFAAVMR